MKTICLLGSTGSIGVQTLEIVRKHNNEFKIVAMSCRAQSELFLQQIIEFKPVYVAVEDLKAREFIRANLPKNTILIESDNNLVKLVEVCDVDIVVTAIVGMCGLLPTLKAVERGLTIALANKETLVAGGELVMKSAKKHNATILPVDSEHSAIWQAMNCSGRDKLKKVILTASGGPFRGKTAEEIKKVQLSDALKHPTWTMGAKVTIDSATLMNKGLEFIEAMHLFELVPNQIEVVVHPESIIHSMVEFKDNSVLAQLSNPSMLLPIQYALTYPDRLPTNTQSIDWFKLAKLTFYQPDLKTFKCLKLAMECAEKGDLYPTVMNGANEIAVDKFLKGIISFSDIAYYIEDTLNALSCGKLNSIEDVLYADRLAREYVLAKVGK